MQAVLWDRRLVVALLDHVGVPTPKRIVVSRDGGPKVDEDLKDLIEANTGLKINESQPTPDFVLRDDGNAIIVDGKVMEKPFVEKPVSGEDHNVYIYFRGGGGLAGGGRRLFRKVV